MYKKLLVLDSSGTINDALPERFLVAHNAYIRFNPSTNLLKPIELSASEFIKVQNRFKEIYDVFKKFNVYVQKGSDTYVIFKIIEEGIQVRDEEEFLRIKSAISPDKLNDYFNQFKQVRKELRESDKESWYKLQPAFKDMPSTIRQLDNFFEYIYVLTAKDSESVFELVKRYKLDDIIDMEKVYESQRGKPTGLKELAKKHRIDYNNIIFVEDSLPNLRKCSDLGIVGILAGWGYNNEAMKAKARQLGIPIAEDASHLIKIVYEIIG